MPICLIEKKPRRVVYQFFLEELVPCLRPIPQLVKGFARDHCWKIPDSLFKFRSSKEIHPIPFIRGIGPWKFFSKDVYHLDNLKDRLELTYLGFLSKTPKEIRSKFKPKAQQTLDSYFIPPNTTVKKRNQKVLKQRRAPIVSKDRFCADMPNWIWDQRNFDATEILGMAPLFYLNSDLFTIFDKPTALNDIRWPVGRRYLPSDVIKLSLYQLLQGFDGPITLYNHLDLQNLDILKDHLAICRQHTLPGSHRFASDRIQIGFSLVHRFFTKTVEMARNLGLIYDDLHGEDGQFFETWLKRDVPRRSGLPQFFGGFYNHGGKKKGIGVYQAPIVDITPNGVLPIFSRIVTANRNENVVSWETITAAQIADLPPSRFFVADKGLSSVDTQDAVIESSRIPIIPIRNNIKKGVIITPEKHHHFYQRYVAGISGRNLDDLFDMRTAIERWHNLTDNMFGLARLHTCGEDHIKLYIELAQTLTVLIAITAFKMGRPDLMGSPNAFQSRRESPREVFPIAYMQINKNSTEEVHPIQIGVYHNRFVDISTEKDFFF